MHAADACMQPMHACRNSPLLAIYVAIRNRVAVYTYIIWPYTYIYGIKLVPYMYGIAHAYVYAMSHMRMGQHTHMGQNSDKLLEMAA